ncbi:flavin reductase family protein [Sulfurisphaera ohwakuensis]|uniref:Flavin reductase n=1 Tax=Sulfurisphaera ohwakuensis TaxID=69656 RepID=A0A650CEZ7_SULOH|nr:flavin reductase family protein [Sulfurisphaera ohwakuensis]MBB5254856.1 flavin reductase (DIM6/NTAB) family NADH-FMN oxidoreductase RutF [Sulfurisphaera ohwakuensis]QGR16374.1 flavin reductase [Sulfurisphaera ohwakuensis]
MAEVIKSIMRKFPLGVAIITTVWKGELVGMTVNTFNSLSLNPPLVSFFADRMKGNDIPYKESKYFVVNFTDNEELFNIFALKPVKERFREIKYKEGIGGCPILYDSYAYIEAKLYDTIDVGDHSIIVGEVIDGYQIRDNFTPLVYMNRKYYKLFSL